MRPVDRQDSELRGAAGLVSLRAPDRTTAAVDEGTTIDTSKKVAALCSVASYPVPAASVEVIETHFAWVFLVGEHAYKMKKPAAYPLLDLRSLEDRHRNCQDEVRLNLRLAPDVYLGAVPLVIDEQGMLKVNGQGAIVDWLVWMKRLPSDCMLDRAIVTRSATPAALVEAGMISPDHCELFEFADTAEEAWQKIERRGLRAHD